MTKRTFSDFIKEAFHAPPPVHYTPPAIVQTVNKSASEPFKANFEFVKYIATVENGVKAGYNRKTDTWMPHPSAEGGNDTIGFGHKITDEELASGKFSRGIKTSDAHKLLVKDIQIATERAKKLLDSAIDKRTKKPYGPGTFDKLSQKQKEMLVDFAFNLKKPFTKEFPRFTSAVVHNDLKTMRLEYKRHGEKDGKVFELRGRNDAFYNKFLK